MFQYCRTIRFQDTDAAGVVYFAQIFSMCHEAYEESLRRVGIDLQTFFDGEAIAVPITRSEADFHRPLLCGTVITIQLTPQRLSPESFKITYQVVDNRQQIAAIATTNHVCIDTATRHRCALTADLVQWLHQWQQAAAVPTGREPRG